MHGVDLAISIGTRDMYRQIEMAGALLYFQELPLGRGRTRIQQEPDCARLRGKFAHQPETLGLESIGRIRCARVGAAMSSRLLALALFLLPAPSRRPSPRS